MELTHDRITTQLIDMKNNFRMKNVNTSLAGNGLQTTCQLSRFRQSSFTLFYPQSKLKFRVLDQPDAVGLTTDGVPLQFASHRVSIITR